MSRIFPIFCAVAALNITPLSAAPAAPPLTQEIHELRRDLQLQTQKIEALTRQIADLTKLLQEREVAKSSPEPAPAATTTAVVPRPLTREPEPAIPKAEAVPPPIQHVVEKGETLTSIAKHYNIPLADLLNLNKNTNDRKLQIGQTIKVPAPKVAPAAPAEPPAEKKETP